MAPRDVYSRVDYRRMIAWPARIEREWPLLERVLRSGPSNKVLDLGSGSGEHALFLVAQGFEVVGVDSSPAMVEAATAIPLPRGLSFVEGDMRALDRSVSGPFGGAICLGNALPHLTTDEDLAAFLGALRLAMEPGGVLLIQLLNYDRIFATGQRALPVNVRPGEDGEEVVFVRLMTPRDDGTVLFYPTSLSLDDDRDPPLEIVRSRRVELRGWRSDELDRAFAAHGFSVDERLGGFDQSPFTTASSPDLVVVARAT